MPYVSCQHAMPHFEIFNEHNDVLLPGFFTTEREALEYLLHSASRLPFAKFYHIGHACLDHDEWEHGTCEQHKALLATAKHAVVLSPRCMSCGKRTGHTSVCPSNEVLD